jgi:dTDP-4-amino-4,6-dideoxygalactose transaminase
MSLGLTANAEVVVPSFTFTSVATAPLRQGASLRFADVEPDTLGLSVRTLEPVITDRTKAVIAVHYAGQAQGLEELRAFCDEHGIALIEDAAHSLGASLDGRPLGTFGSLASLSFHETKNLSCGEGGALIINDPDLLTPAEIIREKGTDRSQFFRGLVDKYTWVSPGSSFLLSDLLAAVLSAGLDDWEFTQGNRRRAWERYDAELEDFRNLHGFSGPPSLPGNQIPWHMYYMLAPTEEARDSLLAHCKANDVLAVFHYQSLSQTPQGRRLNPDSAATPVSDDTARRLLRLPLFSAITDAEVDRVLEVVRAWSP